MYLPYTINLLCVSFDMLVEEGGLADDFQL